MNSIELFVGAGGLALGTARAGFRHLAVLDSDANACRTLRRNKAQGVDHAHEWEVLEEDVRLHDFKQYEGRVKFIAGGPPCQPFSLAGKHLGHEDDRDMFPEAVRAVRDIRPCGFVFENVKGLLRSGFEEYGDYVLHQLRLPDVPRQDRESWTHHLERLKKLYALDNCQSLRYDVVLSCLNAADYGVPQKRERVLIVGTRSDLAIDFRFPAPTHSRDALLHDQWISGAYWKRHGLSPPATPPSRSKRRVAYLACGKTEPNGLPWRTVRDAIFDLPPVASGETAASDPNHFLNPGARAYPGHDGSRWDEPAKTLKAGDHGVPGGENTVQLEDGTVRYFSVRECARLQTFPDEWTIEGSWTNAMKQLGNAVPVALAARVALELHSNLLDTGPAPEKSAPPPQPG
ncbi:MAG: DNA cytosine methyltransferase [Gammaproteobacteria bacterium]|nr:DNA cytosine methyltransferase [Gammaproteobacteria bacterium]